MSRLKSNPIHSVITFVHRNPIIYDAAKVAGAGVVLEIGRRLSSQIVEALSNGLTLTATIRDGDPAYDWVMNWIQQSCTKELDQRGISIFADMMESLHPTGRVPPKTWEVGTKKPFYAPNKDEDYDKGNDFRDGDDRKTSPSRNDPVEIFRLPPQLLGITLPFQGHSIKFVGRQESYRRQCMDMSVVTFDRSRDIFDELILAARALYLSQNHDRLSIFIPCKDRWWNEGSWQLASLKPMRPWDSVFLPTKIKDAVLQDAREFLNNGDFYKARGLPYRRGYLLYGLPGTGKTSLITALASHFNIGVYSVSIGSVRDDDTLQKAVMDCPKRCILLFEDIDCAFRVRKKKESDKESDKDKDKKKKKKAKEKKGDNDKSEEEDDDDEDNNSEKKETKGKKNKKKGKKSKNKKGVKERKNEDDDKNTIKEESEKVKIDGQSITISSAPVSSKEIDAPGTGVTSLDNLAKDQDGAKIEDTSDSDSETESESSSSSSSSSSSAKEEEEDDTTLPLAQLENWTTIEQKPKDKKKKKKEEEEDNNQACAVTLSGLLNAIDGLAASEGRLLFATTNHIKRIDPALSRPGRCDVWVEFTHATAEQARDLFFFFYTASLPVSVHDLPSNGIVNAPSIQNSTTSLLFSYSSTSTSSTEATSILPASSMYLIKDQEKEACTRAEITYLAEKFSSYLPPDQLTVSALQGYLLGYKNDPRLAVGLFPKWVQVGCPQGLAMIR